MKLFKYTWSNLLFLDTVNNKKVVIKRFYFNSKSLLTLLAFVLYSLANLELPYLLPTIKYQRIRNEIKANKILKTMGIKVQKILKSDKDSITFLFVEGKDMKNFLLSSSPALIKKIAFDCGMLIGKVHNKNFAFIDCKSSDFIVTKNRKIYSTDNELFCFDAKNYLQQLDLITLAATIPDEVYVEFWKNFALGYKKATNKKSKILRKDLLGFTFLIFNFLIKLGFLV